MSREDDEGHRRFEQRMLAGGKDADGAGGGEAAKAGAAAKKGAAAAGGKAKAKKK